MVTLANRVKVNVATTGTGTITLGSAVDGFQTFADGGITNGQTVRYSLEDDNGGWEVGTGVYSSTGPTLTRSPIESSNSDAAINLSGSARVFVTIAAADLMQTSNNLSDVQNAATAATNLGLGTSDDVTHNSLTAASVQLSGGTGTQGTLSWNTDEETLDLIQNGATLQIGQEIHWHCRNNSGSTIPNGTPVMATGTIGASGRMTIAPMGSTTASNAMYFIGITTEEIANDTDGKVTHFGKVRGLDTSAYSEGDVLYLDPTTDGGLTATAPTSGMHIAAAFVVTSHASVGELAVRVSVTDENEFVRVSDIGSTVQAYSSVLQNTTASFTTAQQSKLAGIEAGATADQTGSEIKTLYEAQANTNAYTDAEKTKLAGIEAGATADQTAAEIKTAYESNANTNAYTDAEKTKLAGIEAGATADQTITAGSGLTGGGTGNVTVSHADTSTQASVDNTGATVIQDVTLDGFGHVTGLGSKTLTAADVGAATASHTHSISQVTGLQTALDNKLDDSQKGAANGLAELDATGKVPSAQLPSYVDDVLEYTNAAGFPATGETGKLYVALDTNDVYRWSGSAYVKVSDAVSSADQATKLATARTISLTGDVSGSTSFDGSANVSITATVANNSHTHTSANITDLTEVVQDIIGADVLGGGGITVSYNDTSGDTTISHTDTSAQASVNNSGATFIQDVTLDTYGHVTGLGSATITPATIGAAASSHTHTKSQITDFAEGVQDIIGADVVGGTGISVSYNDTTGDTTITNTAPDRTVTLTGGTNVTVTGTYPSFTISSTDTNTTYSAGNGISLSGTTFSVAAGGGLAQTASGLAHSDTSSQGSVNNSGATVIQDVTLDTYGHVTGLASKTLTAADVGALASGAKAADSNLLDGIDSAGFTDTYAAGYTYKSASDLGYTKASLSGRFDHLRGGLGSGPFTYAEAVAHAASVGARLPTVEELEDEIAKGTGGGYDSYQCWTCTAVPGQPGYVYTKLGTGAGTRNATATDGTQTAYTRYVATVDTPKVWTSNSDGAGSGLDADLLDGQQGSYYYPASNPNGYTTNTGTVTSVATGGGLTGGTITGSGTISHADTSAQASVNNSGATVIQDVTLDTYGHVTGLASKTLTAADVGAITGNQTITLSGDLSGSGTTSINAQIVANAVGANELNVSGNGTTSQYLRSDGDGTFTWATPPDTNTTYSAGNGISLSGTTFTVSAGGGLTQTSTGLAHTDTSSQGSVNNSGATVIQDVTLDTYGHVTALGSTTLTAATIGAVSQGSGAIVNTKAIWENAQTITANYTITNGYNAMSAGPITINSGVTVTVGAGETWTVV